MRGAGGGDDDERRDSKRVEDGARKTAERRAGLAPRSALEWLALQRALAWWPERVTAALREGQTPGEILAARREARSGRGGRHAAPGRRPPLKARARPNVGPAQDHERMLARLEALGVRVLTLQCPGYPPALGALADAPPVLLVRGRVDALARRSVAIVGARAATRASRGFARRLARELAAAGFTIVSGLARGIDGEAHRGALEARGRTVGVLACGIDAIYPPEHAGLAEDMIRAGAILGEMPPGVPPRRELFALRNRIISGLCEGVVVVEARRRSGTLITVRHALCQGREVFVVPGAVDGPFAEGTNRLLREGARPVCSAADVIEDLGGAPARGSEPSGGTFDDVPPDAPALDPLERRILSCLESGPLLPDALQIELGETPGRLARALLELELGGQVVSERDGRLYRAR